jgi:hypothetical protein
VFTQWLIQSFFPIAQHKPQVVALRKTTNAKPATCGIPVYRTICGENPSGPMNNLKFNVHEVRNGSDIGIFSWMLETFCGPCTRYFQSGEHGDIICTWHRKVTDAKWGACESYRYVGIYAVQLLHGFRTAINIIETTHFIYCTIFIKCFKKAIRPDKVMIIIICLYLFFIVGLMFYYSLCVEYFSHSYLYIICRLCILFKTSTISSICTFQYSRLQSSIWLAYIGLWRLCFMPSMCSE